MAIQYIFNPFTGNFDAIEPGLTSPLTTKGDVWGYSTTDARIPVGSDGQVLTADSGAALGVSWQPSGTITPTSFSFANDQTSFANVTGFAVTSTTAFQSQVSVLRTGTTSYTIDGADTTFNTNMGTAFGTGGVFSNTQAVAIQSNQQIVIGGALTSFNGNVRNGLVRLNNDGTEDTAFYTNLGIGFGTKVFAVAVQANQQILVGGSFTTFNGNTRNGLVRLNSDGTEDTAFYTNLGSGFGGSGTPTVYAIAQQADGKLLIVGSFTTFNGNTRNYIVRLNTDGTEDTAFYTNLGTGFNFQITCAIQLADTSILLGGGFTSLNGTTYDYLVSLNLDGTVNTAFMTNVGTGPGAAVKCLLQQIDGNILVGGAFTSFGSYSPGYLIRLTSNGTVDLTFSTYSPSTGYNAPVEAVAQQSTGRLIVGGAFTTYNPGTGAVTQNYISALSLTGAEDSGFYSTFGTSFSTTVYSLAVQSDDQIMILGQFFEYNSIVANGAVRWETIGTNPYSSAVTFNINGAYNSTASAWIISLINSVGQNPGISFQMTASGQLQYTSTNLYTQTTGVMKFLLTEL